MQRTPVKFVYFDLDDTLLDHGHAEKMALEAIHSKRQDLFSEVSFEDLYSAYRKINPVVWKKYSAGEFSKMEAKVGRFEQLLAALGVSEQREAHHMADTYLDEYSNHWKAIDGALEAFAKTAARFPVGIMTNGFSEIQRAKLLQFPLFESRSDSVIVSEEVGHLKPDVRLFRHAEKTIGVDPEHILYVGDSRHSDVLGGLNAGWQVAWYSKEEFDSDRVWSFSNWSYFDPMLENLSSIPTH